MEPFAAAVSCQAASSRQDVPVDVLRSWVSPSPVHTIECESLLLSLQALAAAAAGGRGPLHFTNNAEFWFENKLMREGSLLLVFNVFLWLLLIDNNKCRRRRRCCCSCCCRCCCCHLQVTPFSSSNNHRPIIILLTHLYQPPDHANPFSSCNRIRILPPSVRLQRSCPRCRRGCSRLAPPTPLHLLLFRTHPSVILSAFV